MKRALSIAILSSLSCLAMTSQVLAQDEEATSTEDATSVDESLPTSEPPAADMLPTEEVDQEQEAQQQKQEDEWDPQTFHQSTPEYLRQQLHLGFGMGVGAGSGGDNTTEFDLFGYHFFALYDVPADLIGFSPLPGATPIAGLYYKTSTAVETPDVTLAGDAYNVGYQSFLLSAGYQMPFMDFNVAALVSLGLLKTSKVKQEAVDMEASDISGAFGLQGLGRYPVLEGLDAHAGVGLQLGGITRFDIELGLIGTF